MNKEKISSQEIIDLVAIKASISKRASEEFLKVMIATIEDALIAGESVKVKNFGTFKLHWNEPRKSVNVQTGEDIIIKGYYKVTFTPDLVLKDLVNEPFAHLEPVRLDDEQVDESALVEEEIRDEVTEPLRIFTEQASEIKNLLSEIQALSFVRQEEETNEELDENYEEDEDEFDAEIDLSEDDTELVKQYRNDVDENLVTDEVQLVTVIEDFVSESDDSESVVAQQIVDLPINDSSLLHNIYADNQHDDIPAQTDKPDNDEEFKAFLKEVDRVQNRKRRILWSAIVLVVLIIGGAFFVNVSLPVSDYVGGIVESMQLPERYAATKENISHWFSSDDKDLIAEVKTEPITIIVPKDTTAEILEDTLNLSAEPVVESVDSLQILFDTPRVYPEFIATVTLNSGGRLTLISKKYYGNPDFWVYIYEANSDRFENPDQINTGSLIHVPKLDPRLIDASNPRCIKKAKELHDLYVKK